MALIFTAQKYIIMQKSLDALWLRQKVTANNIANIDTPGYKSQRVVFEEFLQNASMAGKEHAAIPNARVATNSDTSLQADGNNVDIDLENMTLLKTQLQYEIMTSKISEEFSKLKYVINEGRG